MTHSREEILRAAGEVFLELGPGAPLDQVVERMGLDLAALPARYATRERLIKEVVADNMSRVAAQARAALAEEPDPWSAFVRFVRVVADLRIVALLPTLGSHARHDEAFEAARSELMAAVGALVEAARRGGLRHDVEVGDIIMVLAAATRPSPRIPEELDARVRTRHVGLIVDGLREDAASELPGEPITGDEVDATFLEAHWRRRTR